MSLKIPGSETSRLRALRRYAILDSEAEQVYDDIVRLAAHVCRVPVALISFVDGERVWFKARQGTVVEQLPRENAFCNFAIENVSDLTIVHDASVHPRFSGHPMVIGEPGVRFYAAVALQTPTGEALGNLCVIDYKPGELNDLQVDTLRFLAAQVMSRLESRRSSLSRGSIYSALPASADAPVGRPGGVDLSSPNVTSTKEWVERCVAHMLRLDRSLNPGSTVNAVHELSLLRHWRLKRPEAAAEDLFVQSRQRPGETCGEPVADSFRMPFQGGADDANDD